MKEVDLFSKWADTILEEVSQTSRMGTPMKAMADRPLPRQIDIQYKAQRAYPELSPEQALAKFLDDELELNDKVNSQQNNKITHIDKEVNDVEKDEQAIKTDVSKIEHDEVQIQQQLNQLINLIKKTR